MAQCIISLHRSGAGTRQEVSQGADIEKAGPKMEIADLA